MLRVAVVGGGGFVGSRLIALGRIETPFTMIPVLRSFRGLGRLGPDGEGAVIIETRDLAALTAALRGCEAVVNATSGDVLHIEEDTKTIVKACRNAGVKRLIHISSTIVFGRVADSKIDDDSPTNMHAWNLYARNKARAEAWLHTQMGGGSLQIVVLRPGLIWGPGSMWARMVGEQLWQGNAILSNNGRGIANLVYVDNLVRMILTVVGKRLGQSGFYNVADCETVTWCEWYRALAGRLGYPISDVRLSPSSRLHLSPALVIEWCSNRGRLMRWAKQMPKGLLDIVKRILRSMAPSRPVPFRQLIGGSQIPLRLSRSILDIQNTAHRLPTEKFQRDFGPLKLISFEQATETTGIWLRCVGFAMAENEQRGHGVLTEIKPQNRQESYECDSALPTCTQKTVSSGSEERRAASTDITPGVVQTPQTMSPTVKASNKAVSTVVIGYGAITDGVYRACLSRLEQCGHIEVVGIVEPNPERLDQGKRWFPKARALENVSSCFAQLTNVELTVITTPPPLHCEHAVAAFENGSHVLTEKPLASSVKSGREMVEAATSLQRVLAVGMPRRFYSALHEARRRLVAGELGDSIRFDYREGGVYSWPVATPAPFRRETSGGGVLLDKGAHAIDALIFLFGSGEVVASTDDGTDNGVESNAVVQLAMERGTGTLQMSWDMELNSGLNVVGNGGELWMPIGPLDCLYARRNSSKEWQLVPMCDDWPIDMQLSGGRRGIPVGYHECFTFQLIQMLRAIRFSEPPAVSGAEALISLGLIESAYAKATPLAKPWRSEIEQAVTTSRHWHRSAKDGQQKGLQDTECGATV